MFTNVSRLFLRTEHVTTPLNAIQLSWNSVANFTAIDLLCDARENCRRDRLKAKLKEGFHG